MLFRGGKQFGIIKYIDESLVQPVAKSAVVRPVLFRMNFWNQSVK